MPRLLSSFCFSCTDVRRTFGTRKPLECAFAERVVREYKRFCILAMRSGHHVTPSEAVDQAWHLHLTYTRSYWDRFCGQTLQRPLHHEPTQGGENEGAKFNDWYSRTLESYQQLFGEAPPGDIWPAPKERFAHAGEWKWINVGHYWLIPRAVVWPAVAAALLIAVAVIVPGCASALGGNVTVAEFASDRREVNLSVQFGR